MNFDHQVEAIVKSQQEGKVNIMKLAALTYEPFFAAKELSNRPSLNTVDSSAIYNDGKAAIALCHFEAGASYPHHSHVEKEILIVLDGELSLICPTEDDRDVREGECCFISPGVIHSIEFPLKTTLIAITIPASPAFPNES